MKNLIKDETAVAYLLLVGVGLTLIVTGLCFSFVSDFVDTVLGAINSYNGTPLAGQMDSSSIDTGNMLLMAFKLVLVPSLFCIMFFAYVMAQKPQQPW
jgi:hypothetical protein